MNKQELQNKISELEETLWHLQEELEDMEEQEAKKGKIWKPDKGEEYWNIECYGEIFKETNTSEDFDRDIINFGNCYPTKEKAEFALKYQNITRTETLSLPTWGEFKIIHFIDNVGTHYELEKIRNKICLDFSNDGEYYIKDLQWEATKENYLEACELCRKLFLGENDDK